MIYDELIEELALTLLTKARYEGCISVIDGFSQCEEDKTRIEYPIDGVMRIMPVGSEIWPEECEPLLKKIGAETIGDVADYLNKSKSENSSADDVLFTALLKICYTTFNFIATMLYTQLFDQLFRLADSTPEYNGALPVHVRLMMDEFANVALPKNFKNILAVCRSRNISCDIILQNIAQLKSLFKDDWEGIIGNCDTLLYLGGNEYGTYEYLSKILGKETERTKSQSIGKGSRGSSSDSLQTAGRELCMPDEIRRMLDDECLLLMRSEDPVIDRKYNLLKHPNVKYTPDAGGEPYVIPPDYMGDAVTITMDAVAAATAPEITEEMYEQLDYLEKHPEENYYENEENFSQYDQGD